MMQQSGFAKASSGPAFLNIAGRQRMLSQRIAALNFAPPLCRAEYDAPGLLKQLVTVHETVFFKYSNRTPTQYRTLTATLASFTAAISTAEKPCDILAQSTAYLEGMEDFVHDVERLSKQDLHYISTQGVVLAVVSVCVQLLALLALLEGFRRFQHIKDDHDRKLSSFIFHQVS